MAQSKHRDIMFGRGEHHPAARVKIEHLRFAPRFDDHCTQSLAGETFRACLQYRRGIGCFHHEQPGRIEAKGKQSGCRNLTGFERRKILPHPKQPFAFLDHPDCQSENETRGGGFVSGLRINFVQRAASEAALQTAIRRLMPQRLKTPLPYVGRGAMSDSRAVAAPSGGAPRAPDLIRGPPLARRVRGPTQLNVHVLF
jgi:hypothetical protein